MQAEEGQTIVYVKIKQLEPARSRIREEDYEKSDL
jgi:hypothetical protein